MKRIAITGGIASGKSSVIEILRERGYFVMDLDNISHRILNRTDVKAALVEKFGKSIVQGRGISRRKLGKIVFADDAKRKILDEIMHPEIMADMERIIDGRVQNSDVVFIEVPLLFEAGLVERFDYSVVVYASEARQINRLAQKGFAADTALKRIHSQMPLIQKCKKADFLIKNDTSIAALQVAVSEFLEKLNTAMMQDKM